MPKFHIDDLHTYCVRLMTAAGAPEEDARIIADHCAASMLSGEFFHGMELGTQYWPLIKQGILKPGAEVELVKETPTTLMVDGHFNFGHVVSHVVMNKLIEKAETQMVAAASIRNQTHVGCLIDYTTLAAERGMVALMMTDGAWGPKLMAPYGGRERRLGINPWSMALPNDTGGRVGFDMTSGTVSLMKIRRAHDEGRPIPEGWVIDKHGRPTTDPADFYDGGTVLPVGGGQAHKGYALTFMIEALADVLSGMPYKEDLSRDWPIIDGCFMAVFNVEAFRPLAEFKAELSGMLEWVTSSAPAEGHDRVYYPGERSNLNRAGHDGVVELPDDVWAGIAATADELGVAEHAPAPWDGTTV
jgi:uncharacterized oxidoreductase